jgi:hypothetical protein
VIVVVVVCAGVLPINWVLVVVVVEVEVVLVGFGWVGGVGGVDTGGTGVDVGDGSFGGGISIGVLGEAGGLLDGIGIFG